MKVSRRNESLWIKVGNRELKEVNNFKNLESYCYCIVIGYCRKEIKTKIALEQRNIELRKKLARCCIWSIALYSSENRILKTLEQKYLESFKIWS